MTDDQPSGAAETSAAGAEDEAAVLEAGRLLFARPWHFVMSVPNMRTLPAPDGVEIAFAGRSNVGKSSLINALTDQGGLAKSSNTPGRTRQLNLFRADPDPGLTIVDMPGYGYAKAPKAEVAAWTRLVFDFLRGRPNLARVYLLVDARHGLKANDAEAMDTLDDAAVSYQVVLTKADKPKPAELDDVAEKTAAALTRRPAAFPQVLATSAGDRAGLENLRVAIATLLTEVLPHA